MSPARPAGRAGRSTRCRRCSPGLVPLRLSARQAHQPRPGIPDASGMAAASAQASRTASLIHSLRVTPSSSAYCRARLSSSRCRDAAQARTQPPRSRSPAGRSQGRTLSRPQQPRPRRPPPALASPALPPRRSPQVGPEQQPEHPQRRNQPAIPAEALGGKRHHAHAAQAESETAPAPKDPIPLRPLVRHQLRRRLGRTGRPRPHAD